MCPVASVACMFACPWKGWLEKHGHPLEAMQVDMAEIERKNNKLDVQWRNYQVTVGIVTGNEYVVGLCFLQRCGGVVLSVLLCVFNCVYVFLFV